MFSMYIRCKSESRAACRACSSSFPLPPRMVTPSPSNSRTIRHHASSSTAPPPTSFEKSREVCAPPPRASWPERRADELTTDCTISRIRNRVDSCSVTFTSCVYTCVCACVFGRVRQRGGRGKRWREPRKTTQQGGTCKLTAMYLYQSKCLSNFRTTHKCTTRASPDRPSSPPVSCCVSPAPVPPTRGRRVCSNTGGPTSD